MRADARVALPFPTNYCSRLLIVGSSGRAQIDWRLACNTHHLVSSNPCPAMRRLFQHGHPLRDGQLGHVLRHCRHAVLHHGQHMPHQVAPEADDQHGRQPQAEVPMCAPRLYTLTRCLSFSQQVHKQCTGFEMLCLRNFNSSHANISLLRAALVAGI